MPMFRKQNLTRQVMVSTHANNVMPLLNIQVSFMNTQREYMSTSDFHVIIAKRHFLVLVGLIITNSQTILSLNFNAISVEISTILKEN